MFNKKGFTLVEILIVIGVIGVIISLVLPSLLDVRKKTKDDQRVADLKSTAQSLELFRLKCGFYPGSIVSSECRGAVTPNNPGEDPLSWQELSDILKRSEIGLEPLQNDPDVSLGETYSYFVQLGSGTSIPRGQCYILRARISADSKFLSDDIDNADIISKLAPVSCSSESCKNLYPGGIDCDGDYYCIGNKECFYGN